jgi:hypothetical protein
MFRLPGLMALGYIAAFSETLALAVIAEKGLEPLCAAVAQESEDHIRAAAAWSLGQVGRHTPDHGKAVADTGRAIAQTYVHSIRTSLISVCPAFTCTYTELCNAGRYVHAGWAESIMEKLSWPAQGQQTWLQSTMLRSYCLPENNGEGCILVARTTNCYVCTAQVCCCLW